MHTLAPHCSCWARNGGCTVQATSSSSPSGSAKGCALLATRPRVPSLVLPRDASCRALSSAGSDSKSLLNAGLLQPSTPQETRREEGARTASPQSSTTQMDSAHLHTQFAFTSYLHSIEDGGTFSFDVTYKLLSPDDVEGVKAASRQLWQRIRGEAQDIVTSEPLLGAFLHTNILQHESLEEALVFVLASGLACNMLPLEELKRIFRQAVEEECNIICAAMADLDAFYDRDPACTSYLQALMHRKGFHGIQAQRVAHSLWVRGHKVVALAIQSRMSEVYAVDIHPGAVLGRGLLLDHGTGVVIGETAVIGNNCSLMQNITLGGTGKQTGDRHPKLMDNVLIGASSTILGNIVIGKGSQIGAGSLVLKPVAPHTMVVGSPSAVVGRVRGNPALRMQHCDDKLLHVDPYLEKNMRSLPVENVVASPLNDI